MLAAAEKKNKLNVPAGVHISARQVQFIECQVILTTFSQFVGYIVSHDGMIVKDKLEKYIDEGVHCLFYGTIPALPGGTEESHKGPQS